MRALGWALSLYLFHSLKINFWHSVWLQKAKRQGDFLLVGLHTDEDVGERRGPHLPIMDLHERSLSVLSCRYVDEVIIGKSHLLQHSLKQ